MDEENFMSVKFDTIGSWTKIKLEIIAEYAAAYMKIMKSKRLKVYYIDGFSGAGLHYDNSGGLVEGSPVRVLEIPNPFRKYYFIDLDSGKTDFLKKLCETRFSNKDTEVMLDDCNNALMKLLPKFSRKNYDRLFCLLDPYGLDLKWAVIRKMGEMGIVDLFLHFPIMDINRNAIWKNPGKVPPDGIERMNSFWGDETWRDIAYKDSKQMSWLGDPSKEKQGNKTIADAFRERLKEQGEFKFVPDPIPLKNSKNAVIYYLFFASQNKTAYKIATHLFKRYAEEV